MRISLFFFGLSMGLGLTTLAQHARLPYNDFTSHNIQRLDILSDSADLYTGVFPMRFEQVYAADTAQVEAPEQQLTASNLNLIKSRYYFESLKSKTPWFNTFYTDPSNWYAVSTKDFKLTINPIINVNAGRYEDGTVYLNSRGAEIQGQIDDKIGFYTSVTDNQARYAPYINRRIAEDEAIPHAGFWKPFKEDGYDFLDAQAHVNFGLTKHISGEVGYGRHFIGNGFRSLILSDYSSNYSYAKIETDIWKIHYTNLYGWMSGELFTDANGVPIGNRSFGRKFMALHHLQMKLHKNVTLGLTESIIYSRGDTIPNQSFDFNYLNPVVFYRSIEQNLGSDGNAIMGLDMKWNFLQHFSLYGQFIIDEFNLSFIRNTDGWWGNKYGLQLGARYVDAFGIKMLDLQAEYNAVRPFTYSHRSVATNYGHFNQPLAHPLGANFREIMLGARYQPFKKLWFNATAIIAEIGKGNDTLNYGQNIFKDFGTRESEYGNELLQGFQHSVKYGRLSATYMVRNFLFLDLIALYRTEESPDRPIPEAIQSNLITSIGLRWNVGHRVHEF